MPLNGYNMIVCIKFLILDLSHYQSQLIGDSKDYIFLNTIPPTDWLDVDGNIRSKYDAMADATIVATVAVTGNCLITQDRLIVNSNGSIDGQLTVDANHSTNNYLIVNNVTATLQLKMAVMLTKLFFICRVMIFTSIPIAVILVSESY
jgi:hypothetical protein